MAQALIEGIAIDAIRLFDRALIRGGGRAANDANNQRREKILGLIRRSVFTPYLEDSRYGAQWTKLYQGWSSALNKVAERTGIPRYLEFSVEQKGGRSANYDYLVKYTITGKQVQERKVEFKFGGESIKELPEFFNPPGNKPFYSVPYAQYYHRLYLERVAAVYPQLAAVEKPSEEEYFATVYQANYDRHPFYRAFYDAEIAGTREQYNEKQRIVRESIHEYLLEYGGTLNCAALTEELQRSQTEKTYVIYDGAGNWFLDALEPAELRATRVRGIHLGNTVVVETEKPGTFLKMLLRWKNHLGILYPAWQISLERE